VVIAFLNFSRLSVAGKHLKRFQSETSVLKFPRRSVDEAKVLSVSENSFKVFYGFVGITHFFNKNVKSVFFFFIKKW